MIPSIRIPAILIPSENDMIEPPTPARMGKYNSARTFPSDAMNWPILHTELKACEVTPLSETIVIFPDPWEITKALLEQIKPSQWNLDKCTDVMKTLHISSQPTRTCSICHKPGHNKRTCVKIAF